MIKICKIKKLFKKVMTKRKKMNWMRRKRKMFQKMINLRVMNKMKMKILIAVIIIILKPARVNLILTRILRKEESSLS